MDQQQRHPGNEEGINRFRSHHPRGDGGAASERLRAQSADLFARADKLIAKHLSKDSNRTLEAIPQSGGQ